MALAGSKIAGGNPKNKRVENDFYATNPLAVRKLLSKYKFNGNKMLEPCVGQGHIAKTVKEYYTSPINITALDIVDRGYPKTIVNGFITWDTEDKFDFIITNPPYSTAKEFVEKGMSLLTNSGQMAMFLKIQFLEGAKRRELFNCYPPRYIYVFRNRMATWNNGHEHDDMGKRWATTMCHAWFIWENGSKSEPIIRWID